MSIEERAAAKAERANLIRLNRDWETAETVRRTWLGTFATRKTLPRGGASFTAAMLAAHTSTLDHRGTTALAAEILGIDAHAYGARARLAELVEKADDKRAAVIALTVALAACEAEANREHWRTPTTTTRRYLRALQTWGYQLVEVEQRAAELWTEPDNTNSADSGDDDGGDDDGDGTA